MRARLLVPMLVLYAVSLAFGIFGAFHKWPWEIVVALVSNAPLATLGNALAKKYDH